MPSALSLVAVGFLVTALLKAPALFSTSGVSTASGQPQTVLVDSDSRTELPSPGEFLTNADKVKSFSWSRQVRTVYSSLYDALGSSEVEGSPPMTFNDSTVLKRTWNEVAAWVDAELLQGRDPFEATGGVPVPQTSEPGPDQLEPGRWVAYSRRQVCFLVAKFLVGAKTPGYRSGLERFMDTKGPLMHSELFGGERHCTPRTNGFGRAWWHLLSACSFDPALQGGGQGPLLLVAKAGEKPVMGEVRARGEDAAMAGAGLRVCRYDDAPERDALDGIEPVPEEGCALPTANGPGRDYISGGLQRQALQDISKEFLGGYVFGTSCGLGGGLDERLMVYYPEVAALTFFLSEAPGDAKDNNPPQLRQPAWIFGARRILHGIDGTARFNHFQSFDKDVPLSKDLAIVRLHKKKYLMSQSRPFLSFMSENQHTIPYGNLHAMRKARRNKEPRQREVHPENKDAFEKQVQAWYRAVSLNSYSEELRPLFRTMVDSVGFGPWLAGNWWGDSQLGFLSAWLGHAIAAKTWGHGKPLALDYYMYSAFSDNPANQCFVHSHKRCEACLMHCHAWPLPQTSYWLPDGAASDNMDPCVSAMLLDCGRNGIEDVFARYSEKNASQLWLDIEARLSGHGGNVDKSVFDLLLD